MILFEKLSAYYTLRRQYLYNKLITQGLLWSIGLLTLLIVVSVAIKLLYGFSQQDNITACLLALLAIIGIFSLIQTKVENSDITHKLKQSEQFSQMIFEQAAVGIVICQLDGQLLQVNKAFCNRVGCDEDELLRKYLADLTDAHDFALELSGLLNDELQNVVTEMRFVHQNGDIKTVSLTIVVIYNSAKQPCNLLGQIADISECKRMTQERQRWQDIFNYAEWGIALGSANGLFLEQINPAFAKMHGYTVEELTGQPIVSVFAPQCRGELAAHIQRAHAQTRYTFESLHCHKEGHLFPVEINISVVYDPNGEVSFRIVNVRDISKQKQVEKALKQSEKLFHSIVEQVPVMIFLKDADSLRMAFINRKAEEIMGYSQQEVLGKRDHDFFSKEEADFFVAKDRQTLASKQLLYIDEESLRQKNGTKRILQTVKIGLYDEDGNATHLLGVSQDITERKQVETALKLSEARLNRAQSVAQIGSWSLDIRVNILTWTSECYRIFGIPEGTPLTYETFLSRVHPDDYNYVDRMWHRAMEGETYDIEHRILVKGEVRWIREKADLEFDASGQLIGGIGTSQDITERKHSDSILREGEEKLRGLFELSSLGIALTDMQGHYIEFNPAFEKMTGYNHAELKQLDYWQLTPKKYIQKEAQQLNRLQNTGKYGPYEKEYRRKNGKLIPLRLNGILLDGLNGKQFIWSIIEDISEQRKAEEHLRVKRAEQQQLSLKILETER